MIILIILVAAIVAGCSSILLIRLYKATLDARKCPATASGADGFGNALIELLVKSIDKTLLIQAGSRGLADLDVQFREAQDPFRTTIELVQTILKNAQAFGSTEVVQLVKYCYQLQYSLKIPSSDLTESLSPLLRRMTIVLFANKRIGRTKLVKEGELVDQKTMFPLNSGARVRQPLGVIVFDADEKVISKAKVLCS